MDEEMITATERLYLTADASRLVAEGDPKAATLYCSPGDIIPQSAVDRFKLLDGALRKRTEKSVPASTPTPAAAPKTKGGKPGKTKESPTPPNKEMPAGDDKGDGDQSQGDGTKGDGTQGDAGQGDTGQGDAQTDGGQG